MTKLMHIQDYTTERGERAVSFELHINHMPCNKRAMSEHMKAEAWRASRPLQEALREIAERQSVQRDLVTGPRLDPKKRHSVGVAMRRGFVDPGELRPYMRRSLTLDLPSIAIVSSVGVLEVNSDPEFLQRMTTLSLAVAWACEATGAEVRAVLMEGHLPEGLVASQPYRRAQLAYTLIETGTTTPLQAYSVALHRDEFYGEGYSYAFEKDHEARRKAAALRGWPDCYPLATFPGRDGGHGVHWAREFYQPDIVVGIGNLQDRRQADISLHGQWNVKAAVEDIAAQALRIAR